MTHLLLDPSCSGSGILGREDIPQLALPTSREQKTAVNGSAQASKKRKRHTVANRAHATEEKDNALLPPPPVVLGESVRLLKLASLQSRIIRHAFTFPSATKITYSTCSVHEVENECVVSEALSSAVAQSRGWRILTRDHHPPGLKEWKHRGVKGDNGLNNEEQEACIRCYPNNEMGTTGFFVCGFVRDEDNHRRSESPFADESNHRGSEEEWEGFSDS